jgi:nucleotide-binding universal stress UspA family protein
MFRTILVPLDGSPFAEQALPWAVSIACRADARLELVRGHVLYALLEPAAAWGPYDPTQEAECKQQEQLYLDGTASWLLSTTRVSARTALVEGLEAVGLLQRIVASKADLVVMTTHARGPVGRLLLGSFADQIMRRALVPVLLVPPRDPAPALTPEPTLSRVVIPLDGSHLAEQVLGPAAELARLLDVPCTLLRVVEPQDTASGFADGGPSVKATSYLGGVAGVLRARGLEVQLDVVAGHRTAEIILEQAGEHDLIALATHGRGGLGRLLLGSVAERVIRAARCPVLVYRPEGTARGGRED